MAKETEKIEESAELQSSAVPSAEEKTVDSAKDSVTDQTVSAVGSDAAIFNRQGFNVNIEQERKRQTILHIFKNFFVYLFLTVCAVLAFLPF